MTRRQRLALAALLVATTACREKKKKESDQAPGTSAEEAESPAGGSSPASEPDLPDPLSLDCGRIVPDDVRAAHVPGFSLTPTIEGPIATCVFSAPTGELRPSVSLFCHRRKRDWDFADELARDKRKQAVVSLGRAAYAKGDILFFYPSRLDCLARVIWPGDHTRGAALARAVDAHLSRATVTAAPVP